MAEPGVRSDKANLVADVGESAGVGGILQHKARLTIKPTRFDAGGVGAGRNAAQPAVREGSVGVERFALPNRSLQAGLETWQGAVGVEDGAASRPARRAGEQPTTEEGFQFAGAGTAEFGGRGAGEGGGGKSDDERGGDGFHARL